MDSQIDIVVKGRHMDVSERFRTVAAEKLDKLDRLDPDLQRVDVEVAKETNPRLADRAYVVQLTCRTRGPVIRAEAAAEDKFAAFDVALDKLESRLRRSADRRTDWHKHGKTNGRSPLQIVLMPSDADLPGESPSDDDRWGIPDDGPMLLREKVHSADPMSLDQALYEMELLGHDFFLFVDAATGLPSVVYCRRGYSYGVIRVDTGAASGA